MKVETLTDTIDSILNEEPEQKIIVFTEFVATQTYLRQLLENKGYTVSILNGGMSIEERNEALGDVNNGELVPSARSNCTTLPKQEYRLAGWLYRSATVLCQRCEPLFR